MAKENIIDNKFKTDFLEALNTITNEIKNDNFNLSKSQFIEKYGHLRPNTYEINSPNYKEGYNIYFQNVRKRHLIKRKNTKLNLQKNQKDKILKFLKKNQLNLSVNQFFQFIKKSIEYREYAKFIFTKSINEIFISINELGNKLNIKKNDLSFLDIQYLKDLYYNLNNEDLKKDFKKIINKNKQEYLFNKNILLPDSIFETKNIYFYLDNHTKINFITSKKITSEIIYLENIEKRKFDNKIVCIEQADPGFDFLFAYKINGLITKYGGANSHMAIRCNELSIPAAIGVGEENFKKIINNNNITLDCEAMKIDFIK